MKRIFSLLVIVFLLAGCDKSGYYVHNPDVSEVLHNRPVGSSANELLSGTKYSSLKIEVQYMKGFSPDLGALNHMMVVLSELLNKPDGFSLILSEIPASTKTVLTQEDVVEIEKNNRRLFTTGSNLAIYMLYTNGTYVQPNALGVAYRNTSIVLFGKKIQDNSGNFGQTSRTKLVATIAEHELGHLLGLVNIGSPMIAAHQDASHVAHCSNTSCLMYYASESIEVLGPLVTGTIPTLDAACRQDLTANGGK